MRDLILSGNTSVDLKKEGRENPTMAQVKRYSHSSLSPQKQQSHGFRKHTMSVQSMKSEKVSNSRFSYTSYGSRCSVDLKVVPNVDLPHKEHYRSMSARTSDNLLLNSTKPLHVPTRRENFNGHVSVQLGTCSNQMHRSLQASHSKDKYPAVTRYDNNPANTLNVHDLKSSSALNDKKHATVQETFYKTSLESPNKNLS